MAAVVKLKAMPPWAKHLRWLLLVMTFGQGACMWLSRTYPWGLPVVLALNAILLAQLVIKQTVEIGGDGVMLRSIGWRRFVRFDRIAGVRLTALGVTLDLQGGGELEIQVAPRAGGEAQKRKELHDAIERARAAFAELTPEQEEALLARGSRDDAKWREEMRALGAGASTGYRTTAMPNERLWRVVENPAADPSAREGAAIALRASLDAEGRTRLRVVADGTAAPSLRMALATIAEEEAESEAEEEQRERR